MFSPFCYIFAIQIVEEERGDLGPLFHFKKIKMSTSAEKISDILQDKLKEENLYLVEVKVLQNKKVQIFVDGIENVTINQCVNISRFIEAVLDKGGIVPVDYQLEVSSPGMSNPLRVPMQYQKRIGRTLEILLNSGVKMMAILRQADDEKIVVEKIEVAKNKKKADAPTVLESVTIKYSEIKSAVLEIKIK